MDLSTMIVDMLRGDEASKLGLSSQPGHKLKVKEGPLVPNQRYVLYKREALGNGEPVMSQDEFDRMQSKGTL